MLKRVALATLASLCWIWAPPSAASSTERVRATPRRTSQISLAKSVDCNLPQAKRFIGMLLTPKLREELADAINHDRIRMVRPGTIITQDYNPERINLIADDAGMIMTIRCG